MTDFDCYPQVTPSFLEIPGAILGKIHQQDKPSRQEHMSAESLEGRSLSFITTGAFWLRNR